MRATLSGIKLNGNTCCAFAIEVGYTWAICHNIYGALLYNSDKMALFGFKLDSKTVIVDGKPIFRVLSYTAPKPFHVKGANTDWTRTAFNMEVEVFLTDYAIRDLYLEKIKAITDHNCKITSRPYTCTAVNAYTPKYQSPSIEIRYSDMNRDKTVRVGEFEFVIYDGNESLNEDKFIPYFVLGQKVKVPENMRDYGQEATVESIHICKLRGIYYRLQSTNITFGANHEEMMSCNEINPASLTNPICKQITKFIDVFTDPNFSLVVPAMESDKSKYGWTRDRGNTPELSQFDKKVEEFRQRFSFQTGERYRSTYDFNLVFEDLAWESISWYDMGLIVGCQAGSLKSDNIEALVAYAKSVRVRFMSEANVENIKHRLSMYRNFKKVISEVSKKKEDLINHLNSLDDTVSFKQDLLTVYNSYTKQIEDNEQLKQDTISTVRTFNMNKKRFGKVLNELEEFKALFFV